MEILHLKDLKEIPWNNGGGITREIALAKEVVAHIGPSGQELLQPPVGMVAVHVLSGSPTISDQKMTHQITCTGDTVFVTDFDLMVTLGEVDAVLEIRVEYLDESDDIKHTISTQ